MRSKRDKEWQRENKTLVIKKGLGKKQYKDVLMCLTY